MLTLSAMSDVSPWYDDDGGGDGGDDGGGDGDDGDGGDGDDDGGGDGDDGGNDALSQAEANVSNYVSSSLNVRNCNVTEFTFSFQIFIFSTKMWFNNLTSTHICDDGGVSSFVTPLGTPPKKNTGFFGNFSQRGGGVFSIPKTFAD